MEMIKRVCANCNSTKLVKHYTVNISVVDGRSDRVLVNNEIDLCHDCADKLIVPVENVIDECVCENEDV